MSRNNTPAKSTPVNAQRAETLAQSCDDRLMTEGAAAREDVHSRVTVLGPSMDGDMGFRDHDYAAHAGRVEVVEDAFHNRSSAGAHGGDQSGFDLANPFEGSLGATV